MGNYTNDATPLDHYDSECHKVDGGCINSMKTMSEEELIFMVNVSEQANRPADMMMYLGEYFKEAISTCDQIHSNINRINDKKGKMEQENFYVTEALINSLGTACKELLEGER